MRRLRDDVGASDPGAARVAGAISRVRPLRPSDERMERVLQAIETSPEHRQGRQRGRLSPTWAVVILIGMAAIAGAAAARSWMARRPATRPALQAGTPAPRDTGSRRRATAASTSPTAPPVATDAVLAPPAAAPTAPQEVRPVPASGASLPAPANQRTTGSDARPRQVAPDPAAAVETLAPGFERSLLVDAILALRRDGDPERAAMLLRYHMGHYPDSDLAEEALALAIEAARRIDPAEASTLEARYRELYPKGRYPPRRR